jgi:class 3 adenylate cyclase
MFILDVEGSGSRTDPEKTTLRQTLYRLLMAAFARSGLMWDDCRPEDRGDGVYVLIPPAVPKPILATILVDALERLAREQDEVRGRRLRLRLALHAGEVTIDDHGSSGSDVDLAFALADAEIVRAALRASDGGHLVVVLSDPFFRATARHRYPGLDPAEFAPVQIPTKQGPVSAWLRTPGPAEPPGPSKHPP